jgi:ornithine--oxo-acid transaminase
MTSTTHFIELEKKYGAHIYSSLPLVLARAKGVHAWDVEGKQYIDMMSAYSAVSHGHCHPRLVKVLHQQAETLVITSRSYHSDKLGVFLKTLAEYAGYDQIIPMNSGAEAVETALKAARKWAYKVKGVPENKAEIIVCSGNFHGRTTAIIGLSSDTQYRDGFGPFPDGSKLVEYGNPAALEAAITPNTAAFLVEPIQGEAGIKIPPQGYLKACKTICEKHTVLFLADEIQAGLGRTGKRFCCDHENVRPDGLILGKALGGGMLPVSAFLADHHVMKVFNPGDHGSTFGGNALSCAVATEALKILQEEKLAENSAELGQYFLEQLQQLKHPAIAEVRGKGLFIGLEIKNGFHAHDFCLQLMEKGLLSKETHETVIRFAPPLVITKAQIDEALVIIREVFSR